MGLREGDYDLLGLGDIDYVKNLSRKKGLNLILFDKLLFNTSREDLNH